MKKYFMALAAVAALITAMHTTACRKIIPPTPIAMGACVISGAPASSWTQATSGALFGGRALSVVLEYEAKMWLIAGANGGSNFNDVWSSADGAAWNSEISSAAFSKRYGHSGAVYANPVSGPQPGVEKMWIMGGYTTGSYFSDVYYSTDGVSWLQATASAAFGNRSEHATVVFNGLMWVIAGDTTGDVIHNDVYNSNDGINWSIITAAAAFPSRKQPASAIYSGKIWIIGGNIKTGLLNDVWYSSNGIDWYAATRNAEFSPRYGHKCLVYDGKLWVIGGADGGGYKNDCWYSTDGVFWQPAAPVAPFGIRAFQSCIFYNCKMWVIAGASGPYLNNVWWSQ